MHLSANAGTAVKTAEELFEIYSYNCVTFTEVKCYISD